VEFRYRHDPEEADDAPLSATVDVKLRHNDRDYSCRAVLDSGSAFSTITEAARQALGPRRSGERPRVFGATDTKGRDLPLYKVDALYFAGVVYSQFELTALPGSSSIMLIGRDILNNHRTLLDGPEEEFTIE